ASDSAPLRRAAAVVRDRRHVGDAADLEADRIQRAHRRLAARAGTLDAHFDVFHAAFLRCAPGALGGDLRRERGGLARALEAGVARGRPGKHVALAVGDRHDGVVERRMHVGDALGDVLLDLLARACLRGLLQLLAGRCVSGRHQATLPTGTFSLTAAFLGPVRVRALVRVRWPRTGRPLRWRAPRYVPRSMRRLMFMEFSRRRSPSTAALASAERIWLTSASVRSFTLVVGLMPVAAQMSR